MRSLGVGGCSRGGRYCCCGVTEPGLAVRGVIGLGGKGPDGGGLWGGMSEARFGGRLGGAEESANELIGVES